MSPARRIVGLSLVYIVIGASIRAEPLPGRESDLVLPSLSDSITAVITSPVDAKKTLLTGGQAVRIGGDGSIQWTYSPGLFQALNKIAAFPDGTIFATNGHHYSFPYMPGTSRAYVIRLDSGGPLDPPPSANLSGDGEPLSFPNPIIGVTAGGVAVDPLLDRVYTIHNKLQIDFIPFAVDNKVTINAYDRSLSLLAQRVHAFQHSDSAVDLSGIFVDSMSFVWVAGVEIPPWPLPRSLFVERYPPNLSGPPIVHRLTLDASFGGLIRAVLDPRGGLVVGGRDGSGNEDFFQRVSSEGFSASFREPGFADGPMAVDADGSLYIGGHEPITGLPALVKVSSSDTQAWGASFVTLASDRRIESMWSPSTGTIDVAGTVDVSFPGRDQTFVSRYRRGAGASGRLAPVSDLIQTAEVDTDLASPLVVEARDAAGAPQGNVVVNFSISSAPVDAVGQQLVSTDNQTNPFTGRAKTGFRVGNIPLEYEVKADCPSCGTGSSSVTFQVCGTLPVDRLTQNLIPSTSIPQPWSGDILDNHSKRKKIGAKGCALTAYTMLLNIFKSRAQYSYPVSDPGTLNRFLKSPSTYGFVPDADLNFDAASEKFTHDQVKFVRRYDVDVSPANYSASARRIMRHVDSSLKLGNPALIQVESGTVAGHFLTVIGRCGNTYLVEDPYVGLDYQSISVDDPAGPMILGARIFRRGE